MSFTACIEAGVRAGKLTRTTADMLKEYDDPQLGIDTVLGNLARQKREAAIQSVRLAEAWEKIQGYPVAKRIGKETPLRDGLLALMTKDRRGKAGYDNVEYLAKDYANRYQSMFADALSAFRTRRIGLSQDTERLNKLIKAIYGETVDDPEVMQWAKDWADIVELTRSDFNKVGGSISKNEKWLMPQNHDARALLKLDKDPEIAKSLWVERIRPLLDEGQMLDDLGNPLSEADLVESLKYTFDTITTGGLNKTKDFTSIPKLGKKLSRKGSDRRFLYFKDADSWIQYQKDFGKGDIFTTLTDHMETKAHDTALMEIFGTNPDSNFQALKMMVEKSESLSQTQKLELDAMWSVTSGKTSDGEFTKLADFATATRNVLTASTLGGAFLSSVSDIGLIMLTTKFNNIPSYKALSRQLKLLNPANEQDRIFAVKMGLGAEAWLGRAQAANRYSDIYGTGVTTKIAEGVMRASFLQPWTDAGRKAFGMEFSSMLADNFSKSLNELNPKIKRAFKTYGINEDDWDLFRSQKPLDYKGAKYADMTQNGVKFHQMVMSETDFAVPTPDARVRAITTGGLGRATISGQAWRSATMLKSFPITMATTHFYRAAYQATMGERLQYGLALATSMTVFGAIALQAKDIAAGREPRPTGFEDKDKEQMTKFMAASFAQGGALGIFGDLLFSDVNRFGGGITQTVTGPTGELLDKTFKMTVGNAQEAIKGEETNILGESMEYFKRYSPDTWQIRLLLDGMIDSMTMMVDDEAEARYYRQMRKRQKDYDQGYWWRKGEILPEALQ